ncbi:MULTISPECIES: hypothetical protein [unclassified Streptosporangium]|uniref:hypothetical protein n=1 Tax=unclassified Streptosporangium TaxID=2632669 RepID=UPI002E2DE87B|nr:MULTISPECIES: hypothetical protein [unclassified Streptosporangium]
MRRALGIAAGLALIAAALSPLPQAQASCVTAAGKCQEKPLIGVELTAGAVPRPDSSGRVSYTLNYSMTWTPSFAPYWGAFWVGGRFPKGARGPTRAVLLDTTGGRLAVLRCREHSDGVWCAAGSHVPHRGRIVFTTRLAPGADATARLGLDSFEGLDREEAGRRLSRAQARERFCNHRFTTTVTTTQAP